MHYDITTQFASWRDRNPFNAPITTLILGSVLVLNIITAIVHEHLSIWSMVYDRVDMLVIMLDVC